MILARIVLFSLLTVSLANAATIQLSQGFTNYKIRNVDGPQNVVLVHDGIFSSWTLSFLGSELAKRGFNVLTYDLYGMGKSSSLKTERYSRYDYVTQLGDLVRAVGWVNSRKPMHIIGYGIGASIGAMYVTRARWTVDKFVGISPGYDVKTTHSLWSQFLIEVMSQFPESQYMREQLMIRVTEGFEKHIQTFPRLRQQMARSMFKRETKDPMYLDGLYRRFIGDVFDSYEFNYNELGYYAFPTMIISGENDSDFLPSHLEDIKYFFRDNRAFLSRTYKGTSMTEVPTDEIAKVITRFLNR